MTQTPAKPDTADTLPPTEPEDLDIVPRADGILLNWYYSIDDSDVTAFPDPARWPAAGSCSDWHAAIPRHARAPGETHTYTLEAIDTVGHHSKQRGQGAVRALAGSPDARGALAALPSVEQVAIAQAAAAAAYSSKLKRYPTSPMSCFRRQPSTGPPTVPAAPAA